MVMGGVWLRWWSMAWIGCCLGTAMIAAAADSGEHFPTYDGIRDNVEFWQQIYSHYNSRQIVVHDSKQLMRIYGVYTLPAGVNPYSRRARGYAKREKAKYRAVLQRLGRSGQPTSKLEQQVFALFGDEATPATLRQAARQLRVQTGQADRFRRGVIRSGRYLQYIKDVFAQYDLPEELAYLPHVESSFDYKAYSKFGAAGIWQFIRSTGRLYMKVGYTIDERRDPIRATVAAAKLLKRNYAKLGSWPLAVTAYNHGSAGMQRAVRRLGTKDYMTIFARHRGRRFGFASRNFYSEFIAAKEVAQNYQRYFGDLPIESPLQYREAILPKRIDLPTLVRHLGVDEKQFRDLNLGFRPAAYRYGKRVPKGYRIRLPREGFTDYETLLASLPQPQPRSRPKGSDWIQVQAGDTLWDISRELQVSVGELRALNEIYGSRIFAGQVLRIPQSVGQAKILPARESRVAKRSKRETASAQRVLKATVLPASLNKANPATRYGPPQPRQWHGSLAVDGIHERRGYKSGSIRLAAEETLGHLADWLSVPTQRIRDLNGFSFQRSVHVGETIRVPLDRVTVESFEERRLEYHRGLEEDFYGNYRVENIAEYRVKAGDSIWQLCSQQFEIPLWLIRELNPGVDFNSLKVGTTIRYPVVVPSQS